MDKRILLLASISLLLTLACIPSTGISASARTLRPPEMPPFDASKAINCNMTEVSAEMASNPLFAYRSIMPVPSGLSDANSALANRLSVAQYAHQANWGTYYVSRTIGGFTDVIGVEAMQYVQPTLSLSLGNQMYAPSFKGPDPMPLEVSTWYFDNSGSMVRALWIFDWSGPGWIWGQDFNWLQSNNYFNTYLGVKYYNIVTANDINGNWAMCLYNFATGLWVEQYSTPNGHNVQNGSGQDYYEAFWNTGDWPNNLPWMSSSNQMVLHLTGINPPHWEWSLAYSSLGLTTDSIWGDGSWLGQTHGWNGRYYDWYVGTHP